MTEQRFAIVAVWLLVGCGSEPQEDPFLLMDPDPRIAAANFIDVIVEDRPRTDTTRLQEAINEINHRFPGVADGFRLRLDQAWSEKDLETRNALLRTLASELRNAAESDAPVVLLPVTGRSGASAD